MNNIYNIPSYERAVELTLTENSPFYEMKLVVDGFNVSIFNYRLAQWSDFNVEGTKEMRGLTFIFNTDGSLYRRFILLEKFFNINQTEDTMYSNVKDYTIKSINNKEDGSIVSFVRLPNNKVLGKSKMSFESDQSVATTKIYNTNNDIKVFVDWTLDNHITAVFEYVAPHNRIVLRYSEEELILLRLRDNRTGEHLDINDYLYRIRDIKIAVFENNYTLDELINLAKTIEDKEGWIVRFDNDFMLKIKSNWYFDRHGLLTEDIYRENAIIKLILNDTIDDVLTQISETEFEARDRIENIIHIVKSSINTKMLDIKSLYNTFLEMGGNRKDFAIKYRKDENFYYSMLLVKADDMKKMSYNDIEEKYGFEEYNKMLKSLELYEIVKSWVYDNTFRLEMAREWLVDRGY